MWRCSTTSSPPRIVRIPVGGTVEWANEGRSPAIAEAAVPEPVRIRDARTLDVPASSDVSQEITVLGISLATSWWGVFIGLFAYALPLILYSAWVSIALWDLAARRPCRTGPASCGCWSCS